MCPGACRSLGKYRGVFVWKIMYVRAIARPYRAIARPYRAMARTIARWRGLLRGLLCGVEFIDCSAGFLGEWDHLIIT